MYNCPHLMTLDFQRTKAGLIVYCDLCGKSMLLSNEDLADRLNETEQPEGGKRAKVPGDPPGDTGGKGLDIPRPEGNAATAVWDVTGVPFRCRA